MIVRHAEAQDIPDILRMAREFWAQTDYAVPFDDESALKMLSISMEQRLCVVLVADNPVGLCAGIAHPLLGNNAYLTGAELMWWVDPEYRSGHNGRRLMTAIEDAARDAGLTYWCMVSLESVNPHIANTIYQRAGYSKTENTYLKEL